MKNFYFSLLGVIAMLGGGCVGQNPYSQFYLDWSAKTPIEKLEPTIGEPVVKQIAVDNGFTHKDAIVPMLEDGYACIGRSSFAAGGNYGEYEVRKKALEVGAGYALWGRKYLETRTGISQSTQVNPGGPQTYEHSGVIGGDIFSATTTTYNPMTVTTTSTPYSYERYAYTAYFFRKIKQNDVGSGIFYVDVSDGFKRQTDLGYGQAVFAVIKNSPGYNANVLRGDVVIEVDGQPFTASSKVGTGDHTLTIMRRNEKGDFNKLHKKISIPKAIN